MLLLALAADSNSAPSDVLPRTTASTVTIQQPTKVVVDHIETWKGIVAVKEKQIIIPKTYSSYTWVIDYEKCATFETKLTETLGTIRTTANNENDTEKRARLQSFVEDETQDLKRNNLTLIEKQLPEKLMPQPQATVSTCGQQANHPFGEELCNDLLMDLTLFQDNLIEALSAEQESSRNGGLSSIMTLHQTYQNHLTELQDIISLVKQGEIPDQLSRFFQTECNILFQQCPTPPNNDADISIYRKMARVLEVGRNTGTHKNFLTIGTPCIDNTHTVYQYRYLTLPYKENDKLMKATVPEGSSRLWFKQYNNRTKIEIEQPWGCVSLGYELQACPPQELTEIQIGDQHYPDFKSEPYGKEQIIDLFQGPVDGPIISTLDKVTLLAKCTGQEPEQHELTGINHIRADETCNLRLANNNVRIANFKSGFKTIADGIEDIITMDKNKFIKTSVGLVEKIIPHLVEIADIANHFEQQWVYYVWATTVLFTGGMTVFIYWGCNAHKSKRQRIRLQRKRSRTYVLPREMVTSA